MFRKLTLAAVAAASLSVMALAPTSASAGGFWPHHHHHHHWGHGHGFRIGFAGGGYDGCYVTRRVLTPLRLPLADGERLLLIRPQTFRSEAPVAHAAGVFRSRYARPEGPPPPPCKRKNDGNRQRVEPIAQFWNRPARPRQMSAKPAKRRKSGANGRFFAETAIPFALPSPPQPAYPDASGMPV